MNVRVRTSTRTLCVTTALLLAGCGQQTGEPGGSDGLPEQRGDTATWTLSDDPLVDPSSTFFVAAVTRLGCNSGETGEVLEPSLLYEDDRVLVRIGVARAGAGAATCQGNDAVATEVHLTEPLGVRELVDAACLDGEAVSTADCTQGPGADQPTVAAGVRWAPPAGLTLAEDVPAWQAPDDYSFTVQSSCGEQAFIGEYAVTVREGEVTAAKPLRQGQELAVDLVPALSGMLDLARHARSGDVEVWTDPEGVPRWLTIDPDPRSDDDESCFFVTGYVTGR